MVWECGCFSDITIATLWCIFVLNESEPSFNWSHFKCWRDNNTVIFHNVIILPTLSYWKTYAFRNISWSCYDKYSAFGQKCCLSEILLTEKNVCIHMSAMICVKFVMNLMSMQWSGSSKKEATSTFHISTNAQQDILIMFYLGNISCLPWWAFIRPR